MTALNNQQTRCKPKHKMHRHNIGTRTSHLQISMSCLGEIYGLLTYTLTMQNLNKVSLLVSLTRSKSKLFYGSFGPGAPFNYKRGWNCGPYDERKLFTRSLKRGKFQAEKVVFLFFMNFSAQDSPIMIVKPLYQFWTRILCLNEGFLLVQSRGLIEQG